MSLLHWETGDTRLSISVAKHYKPFLFSYPPSPPLPPLLPLLGWSVWATINNQLINCLFVLNKFCHLRSQEQLTNNPVHQSLSWRKFHFPEVWLLYLIWYLDFRADHCDVCKVYLIQSKIEEKDPSICELELLSWYLHWHQDWSHSVKNVLTGL